MVDDNRFLMLRSLSCINLISDWEDANRGADRWAFCELIVLARHSEYSFGSSFAQLVCWAGNYFLMRLPTPIPWVLDWEKNLNEDGKKWFSELRLDDPMC